MAEAIAKARPRLANARANHSPCRHARAQRPRRHNAATEQNCLGLEAAGRRRGHRPAGVLDRPALRAAPPRPGRAGRGARAYQPAEPHRPEPEQAGETGSTTMKATNKSAAMSRAEQDEWLHTVYAAATPTQRTILREIVEQVVSGKRIDELSGGAISGPLRKAVATASLGSGHAGAQTSH